MVTPLTVTLMLDWLGIRRHMQHSHWTKDVAHQNSSAPHSNDDSERLVSTSLSLIRRRTTNGFVTFSVLK